MKKKILAAIAAAVAFCATMSAQQGTPYVESCPECQPKTDLRPSMTVLLYPQGQASGKGIIENGVEITKGCQEDNGLRGPETCSQSGSRKNVGEDARMDFYFPAKPNGQMIIMTPGGGYSHLSTFNEGAYGSKWLTERGVTVCVLKYRMPNKHRTVTLDDVQNAFRYCRHHASDWGIRQIGVMGGSAGGHLASIASVLWTDEVTRPDFSVMLYPRITLPFGSQCSTKENLLGTEKDWEGNIEEYKELLKYYSAENHVNAQTPPAFIVLSADDNSVPGNIFVPYYLGLIENEVPVEVHIFPYGGHGWGFSSEEYKGKGKDKFARYRPQFESCLDRWLEDQRASYENK